jgi:uncharacterized protein (DUF1697 family)
MSRYVAFLRGVMNEKMAELRRAFEHAGFTDVASVRSSGNVVFGTTARSERVIARRAEAAMAEHVGRSFLTIVRSQDALHRLLETDPYAAHRPPANAKRIVTFLREAPQPVPALPIEANGVRILALDGREVFTVYVPNPGVADFMVMIEKHFGTSATTRTWDTVAKCAKA